MSLEQLFSQYKFHSMTDDTIQKLTVQVQNLQIQVDRLTAALAPQSYPPSTSADHSNSAASSFISPGDRILIVNTVKRPKNWSAYKQWTPSEAKQATVTAVELGRIYFTTDNGISTWRLRKNIRRLPSP